MSIRIWYSEALQTPSSNLVLEQNIFLVHLADKQQERPELIYIRRSCYYIPFLSERYLYEHSRLSLSYSHFIYYWTGQSICIISLSLSLSSSYTYTHIDVIN
jgi:hypothetical protein